MKKFQSIELPKVVPARPGTCTPGSFICVLNPEPDQHVRERVKPEHARGASLKYQNRLGRVLGEASCERQASCSSEGPADQLACHPSREQRRTIAPTDNDKTVRWCERAQERGVRERVDEAEGCAEGRACKREEGERRGRRRPHAG